MFRKSPLSTILSTLLILATVLLISLPALHDGLFHVFDNIQVTRVIAMYEELASGQFPVRYINSFGHGAGSLMFRFYSPLIYYIGAGFHFLGFSFVQSVKLIYLLAIAIGSTGIYLLLRSRFAQISATLGTVAFLSSPYLYHDLYHRGSLTESFAFMLIPWVLWSFFRLQKTLSNKYLALSALLLGITILSHLLTAIIMMGAILVYALITKINPQVRRAFIHATILGLALSAFYLIPAISSSGFISYENNSLFREGYLDHPIPFAQQLLAVGKGTEKSSFLGIPLLISYAMTLWLYASSKSFRKKDSRFSVFLILSLTGLFFFMSPASRILWENIRYLRYIQFPFRLLTLTTVLATIAYTRILDHFRNHRPILLVLSALIVLPFLVYPNFHKTLGYQYTTEYTVDDPCMTSTWANEYLTKWTTQCLLKPSHPLAMPLSERVQITDIIESNNGRKITLTTEGEGEILIGKYYFPTWIATDRNGNNLQLEPYGDSGLIKFSPSNSNTTITLSLTQSSADKLANLISLLSIVILIRLIRISKPLVLHN